METRLLSRRKTPLLTVVGAILLPLASAGSAPSARPPFVENRKIGERLPDATPQELLTSIYAYYQGGAPLEAFDRLKSFGQDAECVFEPALAAAILRAGQEAARRDEVPDALDTDPFVGGQDYEITGLTIEIVRANRDTAKARARFDNGGYPMEVLYDLVRCKNGWRIHDVQRRGTSLRRALHMR